MLSLLSTQFKLLILLAVEGIATTQLHSQNCPAGYASSTMIMTFPHQGQCCSVEVKYCYRLESVALGDPANVFMFEVEEFKLLDIEECWNLDPEQTPPISANQIYEWARKRIVWEQFQQGAILPCPNQLPFSIQETSFQCWVWQFHSFPNPGGPVFVMGPCGYSKCRRVCHVCINIQAPVLPCLGPASQVDFNCVFLDVAVPCDGGYPPVEGCQSVGCSN